VGRQDDKRVRKEFAAPQGKANVIGYPGQFFTIATTGSIGVSVDALSS
jgi:hypothetical protein